MAASRPNAAEAGFEAHGRLARPAVRTLALLLLPILLIGLVTVARANLAPGRLTLLGLTAGAEDATPAELTATAADALDAATAAGGSGYTFEIVQRAAIVFADGSEPHDLGTYLERGHAVPGGYVAEIRRGPEDPAAEVDFEAGTVELRALVREGLTWRDDGAGWYETSEPPGLGLDPVTAALLPTLLRESTELSDVTEPSDGQAPAASTDPGAVEPTGTGDPTPVPPAGGAARTLEATAEVTDVPGIIAVDLADSTELLEPVTFAFDDAGRLVGLTVVARNTRLETDELRVTTTMTFGYPLLAPGLPDPTEALAPDLTKAVGS